MTSFSLLYRMDAARLALCCGRTGAEADLRFFCPKCFVRPTLSLRTESIFKGVFQSESSERKSRVGARGGLILQHESGPEFYRKVARILSQVLSRIL